MKFILPALIGIGFLSFTVISTIRAGAIANAHYRYKPASKHEIYSKDPQDLHYPHSPTYLHIQHAA